MQITEAVREWDYGDYEGLTSKQIKEERARLGLGPWNIWTDGCPGGEYVFFFSFSLLVTKVVYLYGSKSDWIGLDG